MSSLRAVAQCVSKLRSRAGGLRSAESGASAPSSYRARSLAEIFYDAGPTTSLFGLYLSGRVDLLSADERRSLAQIPDHSKARPFSEAIGALAEHLGFPPERVFRSIHAEALESRILYDCYAAVLRDGNEVCVRLLRAGVTCAAPLRLEHIESLGSVIDLKLGSHVLCREVVTDFNTELLARMNFLCEAESAEYLFQDAREQAGLLWAPKVYRELCRRGLLVTERPAAGALSPLATRNGLDSGLDPGWKTSQDEIVRSFVREWLWLTLLGRCSPVQQSLNDLVVQPDGRVGWTGGIFAAIPADAKKRLWQYMAAAAADDPDECCRQLLQLMKPAKMAGSEADLVSAFRQVVTFPRPADDESHSALTLRILRQYEVMSSAGYSPSEALIQFYRGLFSTLSLAHQLCPGPDPLQPAVEQVWVTVIIEPIRQFFTPEVFVNTLSKTAASMMLLPAELDRFLDIVGRTGGSATRQGEAGPPSSRLVSVVLILTAALLLLTSPAIALSPIWTGRIGFAIDALLAGVVLYLVKSD